METTTANSNTVEGQKWEFEMNNNGGMEEMTAVAEKGHFIKEHGLVTGLLTGLIVGAGAATTTWFYQKNIRLKVLEALEYSMDVATAEDDTVLRGKKEINIEEMDVRDRIKLTKFIRDQINSVKMNKDEQNKWNKVIKQITTISAAYGKKEELENQIVIEETKINKNAEQ